MENYTITVKTFAGLEEVLAREIKLIGGKNIQPGRRAVTFNGNKKLLYKANYNLRTALRVLKQISTFRFRSVDDFYKKCRNTAWEDLMDVNQSFAVYSTVINSGEFRNSMFASLKVKDAIVDSFRAKTGSRPNVDTKEPEVTVHVHVTGNQCFLSLDSSGESLHKRGYRVAQGSAPLSEVLAAGMILLSGWKGETDFIDPMCGSGTLPVEAALIATNTPPGSFRKEFAFENWMDYDAKLFNSVASETGKQGFSKKIYASDLTARNIGYAKANARNAKIFNHITFKVADFKDLTLRGNGATIMVNPPYGERLSQPGLDKLYAMIGERLKHQYPGNTAWILSASKELLNNVGLKPASSVELYNGSLKCLFRNYELFAGKRNTFSY